MAIKRVEALYSGNVQGVGFRFTAERLAAGFRIGGFVKNRYDGRVEVSAEGEEETLKSFLKMIKDEMGAYITDQNIDWSPPTGEFHDFTVRF